MTLNVNNIFANLPAGGAGETLATLFKNDAATAERIVSHSHSSPAGFWYDQANDEWVIILRGEATLEFANGELAELHEGDYLTIPRHMKHRVVRTSSETIWLAVHMR